MRLTYDPEVDAAYVMLVDAIAPGQARHQVEVPHNDGIAGQFILDFTEEGKLLGLEISLRLRHTARVRSGSGRTSAIGRAGGRAGCVRPRPRQ